MEVIHNSYNDFIKSMLTPIEMETEIEPISTEQLNCICMKYGNEYYKK